MSIPHVHVGTNAVPSVAAWSARTRPHTRLRRGTDASSGTRLPASGLAHAGRFTQLDDHLAQPKLAEAVGRSEAALSRWETGKATPSAFDLRRIATAFGMSEEGAYVLIYPPAVYSPEMQRVFESIHGLLHEAAVSGAKEGVRRERLAAGDPQPPVPKPVRLPRDTAAGRG